MSDLEEVKLDFFLNMTIDFLRKCDNSATLNQLSRAMMDSLVQKSISGPAANKLSEFNWNLLYYKRWNSSAVLQYIGENGRVSAFIQYIQVFFQKYEALLFSLSCHNDQP